MPDESGLHTFDSLSLDLEVGVQDRSIRVFAGVRPATGQSLVYPDKGYALAEALDKLDYLADGVDFLLGHNLIDFDLPYLQAANSDLRLLRRPAVDGRDTVLFCAWRAWSCYWVLLPAWGKKLPMLIHKAVPSAHAAGLPLPRRELVAASRHYGVTVASCLPTDPDQRRLRGHGPGGQGDRVPTEANPLEEHGNCGQMEEACGAFCQEVGHSPVKQRPLSGSPAARKKDG